MASLSCNWFLKRWWQLEITNAPKGGENKPSYQGNHRLVPWVNSLGWWGMRSWHYQTKHPSEGVQSGGGFSLALNRGDEAVASEHQAFWMTKCSFRMAWKPGVGQKTQPNQRKSDSWGIKLCLATHKLEQPPCTLYNFKVQTVSLDLQKT